MKGLTKPQKSKPFKLKAGTLFPTLPDAPGALGRGAVPAPTPPGWLPSPPPPEHPTLVVIKPGHFKALFAASVLS